MKVKKSKGVGAPYPDHFAVDAYDPRALRERFRRRHWISLPRFLKPRALELISGHLKKARFIDNRFNVNRRESSLPMGRILQVLLNHPALFD